MRLEDMPEPSPADGAILVKSDIHCEEQAASLQRVAIFNRRLVSADEDAIASRFLTLSPSLAMLHRTILFCAAMWGLGCVISAMFLLVFRRSKILSRRPEGKRLPLAQHPFATRHGCES
jgi:hypothetical protein